ncbi:hypothetical protein H0H92_006039 [Tricholoma furcatifolium]|nr:hypothetical protein H0H92_006039 [Tricholoma furcatifolium]
MEATDKPQSPEHRGFLITPSASPPIHRPQPRRNEDQASPTKRLRLSSTPRPSSTMNAATIDYNKAHEEAMKRLRGTWDGLLDKWLRPLDKDDVVHMTTLEVIKDRGALCDKPSSPIQCLIDLTAEDSDDEEDSEDDADADGEELATLPSLDWTKEEKAWDAQLRWEFLQEEQRRKATYGSEVDESEGPDDIASFHGAQNSDSDGELAPHRPHKLVDVDDGSEDELGVWDDMEGNTLYRLPSDDEGLEDDTTQPALGSPEIPVFTPSSSPPPQSYESSHSPPPTSSPPRSSSPLSSQNFSSPIRTNSVSVSASKHSPQHKEMNIHRPSKIPARTIPRLDLRMFSAEPTSSPKPERHRGITTSSSYTTEGGFPNSATVAAANKPPKSAYLSGGKRALSTPKQPSAVEVDVSRRTPFLDAKVGAKAKESVGKRLPLSAKAKGKQKATFSEEDDVIEISDSEQPPPPNVQKDITKATLGGSHRSSSRPLPDARMIPPQSRMTEALSKKAKPPPLATTVSSSPRKRKRVVSSMESEEEPKSSSPRPASESPRQRSRAAPSTQSSRQSTDVESVESEVPGNPNVRRREKRRNRSRQRSRSIDSLSDESDQSEIRPHHRQHSRAPSQSPYPFPQQYPPQQYPHHPQPPMYSPLQDPRAQYIVTQAMQQLLALGSGTWVPPPHPNRGSTPFTPTHHQRHHPEHLPVHVYATPTHHIHPYPYSYDPMLSNATLPPDSPDVHPSPRVNANSIPRKKSLVKRSQSRGRRVSFKGEDIIINASDVSETSKSPSRDHRSSKNRHSRSSSEPARERREEVKDKVVRREGSLELEPDPGSPEPQALKRGRRHQTPAPSSRVKDYKKDNRRASSSRTEG